MSLERRSLRLARRLVTAAGVMSQRDIVLVRLTDDRGRVGVGEAAPLPWAGTEELDACLAALEAAGADPRHPALTSAPAARAAIDLALWDLAGQRAEAPIAALLAETWVDQVRVNALLGRDGEALGREAQAAVRAGHRTLKLKVGGPDDRERVAIVRAAVGPHVAIRLDANGAWTASEAIEALMALRGAGLALVEQPVAPGIDDAAVFTAVHRATGVALAADESATSPAAVRALLDGGGLAAVVLKPMRLGGLEAAVACARLAQAAGKPAIVTSFLGSAVERAGALHLACAIEAGNPEPTAHGLATAGWLAEDTALPEGDVDGVMALDPSVGGHGVRPGPS